MTNYFKKYRIIRDELGCYHPQKKFLCLWCDISSVYVYPTYDAALKEIKKDIERIKTKKEIFYL